MNFKVFSNRVKIIFLVTIIFLLLTIGFFITYLVVSGAMVTLYLLLWIWFGSASTLLFHYLLWQNLPFLQKIDLARTNNYTITISLLVYIILFPIIAFLTIIFLFIFVVAILILLIVGFFNYLSNRKKQEKSVIYR